MSKQIEEIFLGLFAFALLAPLSLLAQPEQKNQLAEVWVVDVPFQQTSEFNKVLDKYINERKLAGDQGNWEIYRTQASSHLDSYLFRNCCFKNLTELNLKTGCRLIVC